MAYDHRQPPYSAEQGFRNAQVANIFANWESPDGNKLAHGAFIISTGFTRSHPYVSGVPTKPTIAEPLSLRPNPSEDFWAVSAGR